MTAKCPRCFIPLPPTTSAFVCHKNCAARPDPQAIAYAGQGPDQSLPPITEVQGPPPTEGNWPTCVSGGHLAVQEVCPRCHQLFPRRWRETDTITIAMAGSRSTGKSVFVGVLIKQLQALAGRMGGACRPLDTASQESYRDNYERVLFEARGLMPPSDRLGTVGAAHRVPLVFGLGVPGQPRRSIVLRDVAGEDFERPQGDSVLFDFLGHADSLFYLVDPLSVWEVQRVLNGVIDTVNTEGGDPFITLNNVLDLVSNASNGGHGVKLAMLLSKFDALQRLAETQATGWNEIMGNAGAAFSRDPSAIDPRWDPVDADLLDMEVRGLLQLLDATSLVNTANLEFADRRFFAVSALGRAPAQGGQSTRGLGIAPFRVLDPLRWVMNGRGWFN